MISGKIPAVPRYENWSDSHMHKSALYIPANHLLMRNQPDLACYINYSGRKIG